MEMTAEVLRGICKEHKLYTTPQLNDKLYCNFKGFSTITNLDPYTGLKALFLEGNALDSLSGLPKLDELKCLFVQQNMLYDLDGLQNVTNLNTLNVSNNNLTQLDNLSCCPGLETLLAAHNRLATYKSVRHLADCKALTTLDLQDNKLDDPAILDVLRQLPNLRCLYIRGNPMVSQIKNYRKTLISAIPTLTYLDDRPVFELERRCAEAWATGGLEAERQARLAFKAEEQDKERRNFEYLQNLRKQGFRKRREALGLPPGDTDPYFDDMSDGEWQPEEEPEELVAARQRLAAFTARENEEEPAEISKARRDLVAGGGKVTGASWQPLQPVSSNIRPVDADGSRRASPQKPDKAPSAGQAASALAAAYGTAPSGREMLEPQSRPGQPSQPAAQTSRSTKLLIEEVDDTDEATSAASREPAGNQPQASGSVADGTTPATAQAAGLQAQAEPAGAESGGSLQVPEAPVHAEHDASADEPKAEELFVVPGHAVEYVVSEDTESQAATPAGGIDFDELD